MKHSKKVALFFSLMPGAGHMYLGLFRQGIQLMLLFLSILFISASFDMYFLCIFIPIIWFYSIFDVRSKNLKEDSLTDDNLPIFDNIKSMNHCSKDDNLIEKYSAYILILMGIFSLINNLIIPMLSRYYNYYCIRCCKSLIISLTLILIGIFMLKGKKTKLKEGDKGCNQEE